MRLMLSACVAMVCFGLTGDANGSRPNVLLLCIDDLRPELASFGKSYIHSPHIDRLAATGRPFGKHYVQAPTCGASRYALLTGQYGPAGNGALFDRAKKLQASADKLPPSLPAWFRRHGYTTVSVGKVSHHPGGRGGADWNDDKQPEMPNSWDRHLMPTGPWQHPRGAMHGLAHGEIRVDASEMALFQSAPGPDTIYPDGLTTLAALEQLELLTTQDKPFFLAVGIIRPHLPFGAPQKYHEIYADVELPPIPHAHKPSGRTTWHRSGEFMKYQRWGHNPNDDDAFALQVRKAYAACVTYADAQVGRILQSLEQSGQMDNTMIVLWGDHGWHLGEHAIWGKHALFEESLHSPLIIHAPGMEHPGQPSQAMVETIDVFPTLCELAELPVPDFVHGVSLVPQLTDPTASGHPAISYAKAKTIRTDQFRLIVHADGYVELYDHLSAAGETQNIAEQHPEVVRELQSLLHARLSLK